LDERRPLRAPFQGDGVIYLFTNIPQPLNGINELSEDECSLILNILFPIIRSLTPATVKRAISPRVVFLPGNSL
jgi:hypothetical protein